MALLQIPLVVRSIVVIPALLALQNRSLVHKSKYMYHGLRMVIFITLYVMQVLVLLVVVLLVALWEHVSTALFQTLLLTVLFM